MSKYNVWYKAIQLRIRMNADRGKECTCQWAGDSSVMHGDECELMEIHLEDGV